MACKIDLEITFYDEKEERDVVTVGHATCYMYSPPAVGTYFGPIQTLVVRQLHYLGIADGTDKDHYKVILMTLSAARHGYDSIADIANTIEKQTPWLKWDFEEVRDEGTDDDEGEDPQDGC